MKVFIKFKHFPKLFVLLVISVLITVHINLNHDEFALKKGCGRFPNKNEILIENLIWQVLELPRGFVKILNAYLDERQNKTIVRINVSGIKLNISVDSVYCQFWYDEKTEPHIAQATDFLLMWVWRAKLNANHPFLITCPLEVAGKLPLSVSLTANPCDKAENYMKIINNQPADGVKKEFGVCSKQITLKKRKSAIRFIEWVHMLRILGADKIFFYNRFVHQDLYKVIEYMEKENFIKSWPFSEPNEVSSWQAYLLEMNVLNDCFYRIRNLYKYVVLLDIDEVIMPIMDKNWHDLMDRVVTFFKHRNKTFQSYFAENLYYPDIGAATLEDVPKYHYMLQHVQRSVNFSRLRESVKSFNIPEKITVVHNHMSMKCLNDNNSCFRESIPKNISQLNHYRDHVDDASFNVTMEDKTLWRFKDKLIRVVKKTLDATHFYP